MAANQINKMQEDELLAQAEKIKTRKIEEKAKAFEADYLKLCEKYGMRLDFQTRVVVVENKS